MSSALAAPSTGAAASRTSRAPSRVPAMSVRPARGMTLMSSVAPSASDRRSRPERGLGILRQAAAIGGSRDGAAAFGRRGRCSRIFSSRWRASCSRTNSMRVVAASR